MLYLLNTVDMRRERFSTTFFALNLLLAFTVTVAISIRCVVSNNLAVANRGCDWRYGISRGRGATDRLKSVIGHLKEASMNVVSRNCTEAMNGTDISALHQESPHCPHEQPIFGLKGGSFSDKKRKILILMSDTGGGHRASAQAIDQALAEIFPGKVDVDIVDIWTEHAVWPFNRFVPSYRFMAKHPTIWRVFYAYGRFPPTKLFTEIMSRSTCYNQFRRAIERSDPDLVLSVHPLCQHIPIPIIKKMNKIRSKDRLPIPFVTVVTDLGGAHPTWFNKGCDLCFVPSEAVRKEALKGGIPEDKVIMHGLPVRPTFWKASSKSKKDLRDSLGLRPDVKTVLLMGGGDGVGGLSSIAEEMGKTLGTMKESTQMVVVCGHNTGLASQLRSKSWPSNVNAVVKGFLNNVDEYMGASDCLVTKAGPGTIAEAMIRGVPVILSSFLPGQEEGNVPYVLNGKFGVYTGNKPKQIAHTVKKWFSDKELLGGMSARAMRLGISHSEATHLISKDIGDVVLRAHRDLPIIKSSRVRESSD